MSALRDQLEACAERAETVASSAELEQMERYLMLLDRWNRSVNLTALPLAGLPGRSLDRLVGEALVAIRLVPDRGSWFDLGSGGGSPAIPLKIMRPGLALTMVESKARKGAFLREVVRELRLVDTAVLTERIEELPCLLPERQADVVSVRAVRVDSSIADAAHAILRPGGCLLLFGSESMAGATVPGFQTEKETRLPSLGSVLFSFRKVA